MHKTINSSLLSVANLGISSAVTVYKLCGAFRENRSFQFNTKTKANQKLFAEGIALSNCRLLDYKKLIELMLTMQE